MTHRHDFPVLAAPGNLQTIRKGSGIHRKRMIPHRLEILRNAFKDPFAVMRHLTGLAMHQPSGVNHPSAEHLSDRLMAETDSENRQLPGKTADRLHGNSGAVGIARPRRDHQTVRRSLLNLPHRDLVVSAHRHIRAQHVEILHDIVCE